MEIIRLTKENHNQFKEIIKVVVDNLEDKDMLIVISDKEQDEIFENKRAAVFGAVENQELLAISGLFWDESDFQEIVELCDISGAKVAEIAECMTLPNARGRGIMLAVNKQLCAYARQQGFDYLIATAHPANKASDATLKKLGMKCQGQFMRYGQYIRNYYLLKL